MTIHQHESDQDPGTIESPRLLELDLSLNRISKVPQLQNLPALEWLSLEVFSDLEHETQNKLLTLKPKTKQVQALKELKEEFEI